MDIWVETGGADQGNRMSAELEHLQRLYAHPRREHLTDVTYVVNS